MQPRARGRVTLTAKAGRGGGVIDDLHMAGAMKCLFPRPRGRGLEAVLINASGGITGGDLFDVRAVAGPGAEMTLTTQAAERAYRAQHGETGRLATRLEVAPDARLAWLPQETILYDGSDFARTLDVALAPSARFLMVEPVVFGRAAMGERLTRARFRDRIEVTRAGDPIYLDGIALEGDIAAQLSRRAIGAGAGAMASVLYVAPDAEAHLEALRDLLPETGGASMLAPDILACRAVAPDSFELRRALVPILTRLHGAQLPRCWML